MKKIISTALAFLLVLCVFTACSKEQSESVDSTPLEITYDSHYENLSESSVRAYNSLCQAVINGDEQVLFNTSMGDDVNQLYYTSFPLNALVKSLDRLEEGNGLSITYFNDKDTHISLVKDFESKVNEIKTQCGAGTVSADRYVFNLYTYICENITIDDTLLSPYDAIMSSKGSAQAISQMFEYLVLQGGGKASHLTNFDNGVNVLSAVSLSGKWYMFYPALEISNNGGKGLTCFAMSYDRAVSTIGVSGFEYTDFVEVDAEVFSNTEFDTLENAYEYTIDGNQITTDCNGTQFILPIN